MLVLTRRPGETIMIELPSGERIQVAVLGQKGNQIRLGIEAPADTLILREELVSRSQTGSWPSSELVSPPGGER